MTVLVASALAATGGLLASPAAAGAEEAADYIVVLEDSVAHPSDVADEHRRSHGAQVTFTYGAALKGYAARLTPAGYAEVVRDPRVAYVERDGVATINTTQSPATWGLDRIDARTDNPDTDTDERLDGSFTYTYTGAGVKAYIIDTGIDFGHAEFEGKVVDGYDAVNVGTTAEDCHGHGTHVAGTAGGQTFGVAKDVTLVAVRVLNCRGSGKTSEVIAGVDWVTLNHAEGAPAVANMSLGGSASDAMDAAVRNSIADGVSYAIAAGNGNRIGIPQDACGSSPARVVEAMTISATDKTDTRTFWANYGDCVDWFAPGLDITSAWIGSGDTETKTISGTSMATPHTAGVAALFLQGKSGVEATSPAAVRKALYDATTQGVVKDSRSANSHLLFTSY